MLIELLLLRCFFRLAISLLTIGFRTFQMTHVGHPSATPADSHVGQKSGKSPNDSPFNIRFLNVGTLW